MEIHGASYVWIKRYRPGERSRRRLSAYVVTQYVSEQIGLVRYWWSWRRTFGVPMVATWRLWRRMWLPYRGMRMCVEKWRELIAGGEVECLDGHRYSLRSFARGGP